MGTLQLLWPACRFVHLIRDGSEVALSMSRHPGFRWLAAAEETWWVPASFNGYHRAVAVVPTDLPLEVFASLWQRRVSRIIDEATRLHPHSLLDVRFEELVANPSETLVRLATFLDLEAPSEWLQRASSRLDRQRAEPRRRPELITAMAGRATQLMEELGYLSRLP
jgi:hypothetical protein